MDEVFIQALITQALAAYTKGGDEALAKWKMNLPLPHREQFERDCGERLKEAIEKIGAMGQVPGAGEEETDPILPDPRKKHNRDQRRTKPL